MKKQLLLISVLFSFNTLFGQTTWSVTSSDDSGSGSLRDAITSAAGGDTIVINTELVSTINLTSAELLIQKNLTIRTSPVAQVTVQRNTAGNMRIFYIDSSFTVSISNLNIKNGNVTGTSGKGGGIFNYKGILTLNNCSVENNSCGDADGGGIHNVGTLTLTNSAVINNISNDAGGGIYNGSTGILNLTNVTVNGNQCKFGGGSGLFNSGSATIISCTFSENKRASGTGTGGSIRALSGSMTIKNTLFGLNLNGDLTSAVGVNFSGGTFTSAGYNMSDNASDTPLNQSSDSKGVNVKINSLANNGGFTRSVSLQFGSPAINAGTTAGTPTTDQLGNPRAGKTDIGAFEYQGSTLAAPTGLYAVAGSGQIELKWSKNNSGLFSKYYIYGGSSEHPTTLIDSTVSATDTTIIISGLSNGTLYYFRLKVLDTDGLYSEYSAEKAAVPTELAGNALSFDGIDDYVNLGNPSELNVTGDLTLEAWIYADDYNVNGRIISKWGLSSGYELDLSGGSIRFSLNQSVGVLTPITSHNGEWVHVAAVKSGTLTKIYINGVYADFGSTASSITTSPNNLLIGEMANLATSYFNGKIDEVRIWNVARTETEIAENISLPLRGDEVGLVGLWHFDEPSGIAVYDATPNENNGTIMNGAVFVISGAMFSETLPVELSSFTAQSNNGKIQLNWSTVTESNNAGWEVEVALRQAQGDNSNTQNGHAEPVEAWTKIAFIPGKGTTTESHSYQFQVESSKFQDPSLEFRLKQIDLDGKFTYSNILKIDVTPNSFGLSQNYPNPFNPNTVISYKLQVQSDVRLVVFDLLGREVVTLVNEKKEAGSYTATFNGANLTSGVYFYKLSAGNFSEIKKMTLVK